MTYLDLPTLSGEMQEHEKVALVSQIVKRMEADGFCGLYIKVGGISTEIRAANPFQLWCWLYANEQKPTIKRHDGYSQDHVTIKCEINGVKIYSYARLKDAEILMKSRKNNEEAWENEMDTRDPA